MTKTWLFGSGRVLALALAGTLMSCTSDKKPEATTPQATQTTSDSTATGTSVTSFTPGEAGGVREETVTGSAIVDAIDPATRKITLKTDDGTRASFTAGPEVRNFDRIHVGDKVTATLHEQLAVTVDREAEPGVTHAGAVLRAPKGANPGAIVAEVYEVVATVKSIDTVNRRATLQFVDNQTRVVPIRPDVDLSKYKAGDRVTIRVTQQLSVLVAKP